MNALDLGNLQSDLPELLRRHLFQGFFLLLHISLLFALSPQQHFPNRVPPPYEDDHKIDKGGVQKCNEYLDEVLPLHEGKDGHGTIEGDGYENQRIDELGNDR